MTSNLSESIQNPAIMAVPADDWHGDRRWMSIVSAISNQSFRIQLIELVVFTHETAS
jgi:hypothetical protein